MEKPAKTAHVVGFYVSILTAVITLITFGIAMLTPPISGANCQEDCLAYPYLDITSRFPRDYWWMYGALAMLLIYVAWVACLHHYAAASRKIFSQVGLALACMAAAILIVNYFVQTSVIQSSLENGETAGITLLTQYNPHGLFIALEEVGYLLMSLAFLFLAPVFSSAHRVEKTLRWMFAASAVLALVGLIVITLAYGIDRQDRFEVIVISIDWLVLIVGGFLSAVVFRRAQS